MNVHLFRSNGWTIVEIVQTNIMYSVFNFPKSVANDILTSESSNQQTGFKKFDWFFLLLHFFFEFIQNHIQHSSVINWIGLWYAHIVEASLNSELSSSNTPLLFPVHMSENVTKRDASSKDLSFWLLILLVTHNNCHYWWFGMATRNHYKPIWMGIVFKHTDPKRILKLNR